MKEEKALEWIKEIQRRLDISPYFHKDRSSYFSCSDLAPPDGNGHQLHRRCKQLYESGYLNKRDAGRWGWWYQLKEEYR